MRLCTLIVVCVALAGCDPILYDWQTSSHHARACPAITSAPGVWQNITPPELSLIADAPTNNRGALNLARSAAAPATLYLGTYRQGIWKSTDSGDRWQKVSTGQNHEQLDGGENTGLAVDPTNSDRLYATSTNGEQQGLWLSVNGGVDWQPTISDDVLTEVGTPDVGSIAIDPRDPRHLLVAWHGGWHGGGDAGFLESVDGGSNWTLHEPAFAWQTGLSLMFLPEPDHWLLSTQWTGVYLTTNAGADWTRVNTSQNQAATSAVYAAASGVLYAAVRPQIIRSSDGGVSWISVGPSTTDGFASVIGDGERLFASSEDVGLNIMGPQPTYVSADSDGLTWDTLGTQALTNGPRVMVADPDCNIIWSANELAGVYRMLTH